MNQPPSALIRYPILSLLLGAVWLVMCLVVWFQPTAVCLARPTPTATTTPSAPEPSVVSGQTHQPPTPTPAPKTCNPVLLQVLPPTAGPTHTPTTDPRSTVERLLADLDLAQPVAGYRILSVQAIGPIDWVEPGAATTLVVVPTTLPTPAPPEPRTPTTPTPTPPVFSAAGEQRRENNQVIDAVIVRIDQPGTNGLIPLLIAVDQTNFNRVRNLIGRSVVYPVHLVATPAP